jgi:glycosyltransferase involved in cell wall biosynthesis
MMINDKPLRLTFVSDCPIDDKNSFSGVPYYMGQALRSGVDEFEFIRVPGYRLDVALNGSVIEARSDFVRIGQFLSERLKNSETDVVVCLGSSMIPYLETDKPVVLWHDSTWFGLQDLDFPEFKRQHPLLFELDQSTFDKTSLVAFAADWLRDQTLTCYEVLPDKVQVVPFGANLDPLPPDNVARFIANRAPNPCTLTFVGVEWERKGLPLAHAVAGRLNAMGLDTVLNVLGCSVDVPGLKRRIAHAAGFRSYSEIERFKILFNRTDYVNRIGFLDKDDPEHISRFVNIISNTHFLIHPASFECFGIVMAEANAYGVPVLATDQYGPKTVVRNGINGHLFSEREFVEAAADFIYTAMMDYESYKNLAHSSYNEYRDRLNWSASVNRLKNLITEYSATHP